MKAISLYLSLIVALCVYSWALVDPNFTLFSHSIWTTFRNTMIQLGYFQRPLSSALYIAIIIALFIFQRYFFLHEKKINPLKLAISTGIIMIASYPFLSHDFFNYMFDARIATYYHQNPYIHKALDFPADSWLRFMHWTHRPYPYGPTFLIITLIPSILSFGKLIANYILFKGMCVGFYLLAVWALTKKNRQYGMWLATSPLMIIEGLINGHNDLIALSLALLGTTLLSKKLMGKVVLLASGGIKYITLPLVFLTKKTNPATLFGLFATLFLVVYISIWGEIQPWYFLNLLIILVYIPSFVQKSTLFQFGLMASYYPYLKIDGWSTQSSIIMKHSIIVIFLIANVIYLVYTKLKIK